MQPEFVKALAGILNEEGELVLLYLSGTREASGGTQNSTGQSVSTSVLSGHSANASTVNSDRRLQTTLFHLSPFTFHIS